MMSYTFKKFILFALFNTSLFCLLIIGIQNSSKKIRVNLLINDTVALPISFTVGTSFIIGSIIGSLITFNYPSENKD